VKRIERDKIFIIDQDNKLQELNESEFEREDDFQKMLEEYPDLISGSQINPESPRKWLLISREYGISDNNETGNRWSIDHLFVDQDAIPTLVEVKRSSDTRLRREVIGQMLEYAANSVSYWKIEDIKEMFEAKSQEKGDDPLELFSNFNGNDIEYDEFWEKVDSNLKANKIRLLFVADIISKELKKIIEFLNENMPDIEVLGVEIKQYSSEDIKTLVPRVYGQTSKTIDKSRRKGQGKTWTKESFINDLNNRTSSEHVKFVNNLLQFVQQYTKHIWFGSGQTRGSLSPRFDGKYKHYFFSLLSDGRIEFYLNTFLKKEPFADEQNIEELFHKLNNITGLDLESSNRNTKPKIEMDLLFDKDEYKKFTNIIEWIIIKLEINLKKDEKAPL
jgi:hypothetical protein